MERDSKDTIFLCFSLLILDFIYINNITSNINLINEVGGFGMIKLIGVLLILIRLLKLRYHSSFTSLRYTGLVSSMSDLWKFLNVWKGSTRIS